MDIPILKKKLSIIFSFRYIVSNIVETESTPNESIGNPVGLFVLLSTVKSLI